MKNKRFDFAQEYRELDVTLKTPEELEQWLNKETKYYLQCNAGFYGNNVIFLVEKNGKEKYCYVDYHKGKYPPSYTPEEYKDLDMNKIWREPAVVRWDWEWTTISKEEFPLHVKEAIWVLPPQTPVIPWLWNPPE